MEALKQARSLYIKSHDNNRCLKDEIPRYLGVAVKESPLKSIFTNPCMLRVLEGALRHRAASNNPNLLPVIKAFESLERYILLLVDQPWKPEYKKLKMYGGFYRTKIKSVLLDPEEIFFVAGYMQTTDEIMTHKGFIDKTSLLLLAFDCKIAAIECQTVSNEYSIVKNIGKSFNSVVCSKLGIASIKEPDFPLIDISVPENQLHVPSHSPYNLIGSPGVQKTNVTYQTQPFSLKSPKEVKSEQYFEYSDKKINESLRDLHDVNIGHREHTKNPLLSSTEPIKNIIPPIDVTVEEKIPELPQGTVDDHMRESLKLMSQESLHKSSHHSSVASHGSRSGDWPLYQRDRVNSSKQAQMSNIPFMQANPLSVNTYPPGIIRASNDFAPQPLSKEALSMSIDEGIQVDLNSSKFAQPPVPQVPSRKPLSQQRTTPPQPDYKPQTSLQSKHSHSAVIYSPPALLETESLTKKSAGAPPPIPSRALKPTSVLPTKKREDLHYKAAKPTHSLEISPHVTEKIPGHTSNSEPILRRDQIPARGKSSSLKYGDEKGLAVYKAQENRLARSMDMTLSPTSPWQSGQTFFPVSSGKMKACPKCTLENSPDSTHCAVCNNRLQ